MQFFPAEQTRNRDRYGRASRQQQNSCNQKYGRLCSDIAYCPRTPVVEDFSPTHQPLAYTTGPRTPVVRDILEFSPLRVGFLPVF
jgi:hypothetical protein